MIEIRIRRSWDANAVHLADVYDVSEIDNVLRSLKAWGIADLDDPDDVSGQWVVDEGAAYFEFVIEDDA